ncbi:uncharacterized protein N7503_001295 [Penicillium pulvis]|uniref:uncharacterized protein n=1 Tax=Penicillium pulvis TaxID=1562058 RepID=UPI002549AF73|nr:uncharacterized protein N7503_001295 [Penicillium pulvis]KAJ5809077.1 hypothetical protein N7503_001295 [Penicillium pulvis]
MKPRALSHELSEGYPAEVVVDEASMKPASVSHNPSASIVDSSLQKEYPNEENLRTLHRVPGKISWITYTIAFVELCERFSYYGTTAIRESPRTRPLPAHATTGALATGTNFNEHVPGALGMGQRTSTALTLCAYVADQYWGRYRMIFASLAVALVGHAILVISAISRVIGTPRGAIACSSIGLVVMGIGTSGFKYNISPLIAEQYREDRPYIRGLPSRKRIIVGSAATISRVFLYFYMMINVGSLLGQIGMVYAERYVGFWLSFLLSSFMFYHPAPHHGPIFLSRSTSHEVRLYFLKRITAGFFVAGCAMISATVTQHCIYNDGPYGKDVNHCLEVEGKHTNISVWVQTVPYVLGGISEIFASVTSLQYAFTKAPHNMRSLVAAVSLFMTAFSSALGQALVALSDDPLLEWNHGITAILAFVGGLGFWFTDRQTDSEEDALNMLPESHFSGKVKDVEGAK